MAASTITSNIPVAAGSAPDYIAAAPCRYPLRTRTMRRILHHRSKRDPLGELNGLLAAGLRAVTEHDVAGVREGAPDGTFALHAADCYREQLLRCLADRRLTDEEVFDLRHLRTVLGLDPAAAELAHRRVARQIYARTLDEVLADGIIDATERAFLAQLREHLTIPDGVAENMLDVKSLQHDARNAPVARRGRRGD